ncbi:Acetylcholinesterase [Orbilia brochopaga]|nr:Acetylcholinesterase [Drechslerella brochopaga]
MHWVKENIKAFGGDPSKVTLFGVSAGAASIGFHGMAFDGRDDGLFRGAIMESGSYIFYAPNTFSTTAQRDYDGIVKETNCTDAVDTLQCLRTVPINTLYSAISDSASNGAVWQPVIDGNFVTGYGSEAIKNGKYTKVPLIIGTTSEEGAGFVRLGLNTTDQLVDYLATTTPLSNRVIYKLLDIYDESVSAPPRENFTGKGDAPLSYGTQWHRITALYGDYFMIANKRLTAEILKAQGVPVWTYRFRAVVNGAPAWLGATHSSDVSFLLDNKEGLGYPGTNPMLGPNKAAYSGLADIMSRNWIRFIVHGDPAIGAAANEVKWIKYRDGNGRSQIVFDTAVAGGTYLETDNYRSEGISLINQYVLQIGR